MYLHKIEERLGRSIDLLRLEIENMEPGEVNQWNETRESLTEEMTLMRQMAEMIVDQTRSRQREAIDRMSKMFHPDAAAAKRRRSEG